MKKFKKLITLLTTNFYVKFLFKCDLKLISFFSDNLFGYIFYIFCIFYGFFGCQSENCNITHSLATIFVLTMIGLVLQTYILVKIPFTRDYLENLLGKNYIENHLGKYTGSEAVIKLLKYMGPALSLGVTDHVTASLLADRYYFAANLVEENFHSDYEKMGKLFNEVEFNEMRQQRDKYLKQAANAKGIISRGFAAGASKFLD